ncbi:MAG: poly-gamma-glutamate synthase PgsB [Lachnospiraceae bacterium]|jgi:poly-gamma-glutamate synthase PgsB/CapB|nr:poly-gamma-glutamate synthase PgsB [Lachnospiraceae bacterium]RKJ48283.1 poly-gamma-glutamate synthase PgsB [bacterium 1XD42-54]
MKNYTVTVILILCILMLIAGVMEKWYHRRNLKGIPIRIMVNGTRGKTSVTRLIAAILREAGIRTWAKTTGTQAAWILPDGSEQEYRKKRPVNIREQIPFIKKAKMDGAEAIVVECMALHPENQRMMAEELVQPTIGVITNVRVDHVMEIGATEAQTVRTLALSIGKDTALVCDDARFDAYTSERVDAMDEPIDPAYIESFEYPVYEDNIRLALRVARMLDIDRVTALRGMKRALPDIGMRGPFRVGKCLIINAFAANDIESSRTVFRRNVEKYKLEQVPVYVLFNNRSDREFRLQEFAPFVQELAREGASMVVTGENRNKAVRYFIRKTGIAAEKLAVPAMDWLDGISKKECAVLCIGNIANDGKQIIEALEALGGSDLCCSRL